MGQAGITPAVDPSTGDLNSIILAGHPGVTLGLTRAENLREANESISNLTSLLRYGSINYTTSSN